MAKHPIIKYYDTGEKLSVCYTYYGKPHKLNGPAIETFNKNGTKSQDQWYYRGNLTRYITYNENGYIENEMEFKQNTSH